MLFKKLVRGLLGLHPTLKSLFKGTYCQLYHFVTAFDSKSNASLVGKPSKGVAFLVPLADLPEKSSDGF